MAYDFHTRLDRLGDRMEDLHQNTLTYQRRGYPTITINNFTPEKLDTDFFLALGMVSIVTKGQSFVFDVADLSTLNPPEPQLGDKITWNSRTYQILPVENQEFRYTTSTRKRVRIFTEQIS